MKNTCYIGLILLIFTMNVFCQNSSDTLTIVKHIPNKEIRAARRSDFTLYSTYVSSIKYLGFQTYMNGKALNRLELDALLRTNTEAYKAYLDAKDKMETYVTIDRIGLAVINIANAVFLVYGLLNPGYFYTALLLEAAVILPTALVLAIIQGSVKSSAYQSGIKAIGLYNRGIRNNPVLPEPVIAIGFVGNGLGFRISF